MILTKIADKYLADWLKPVSQEQDDKALSLIARLNAIAFVIAIPFVFLTGKADSVIIGIGMLILMPQLVVLNLANTLLIAGKKRVEDKILPKEFLIALLTTSLMYIDLFVLVSHFIRSSQ